KSGMSLRRYAFSTSWISLCMATVPQSTRARGGPPGQGPARRRRGHARGLVRLTLHPGRAPPGRDEAGSSTSVCHTLRAGAKRRGLVPLPALRQDLPVALVEALRVEPRDQVRPHLEGTAERLVAPPARDPGVVPGEQ